MVRLSRSSLVRTLPAVFGCLLIGHPVASDPNPQPQTGKKAYILVADDFVGSGAAAREAKSDFEGAGYAVEPINYTATAAAIKAAFADPAAWAIWFTGHGIYNTVNGGKLGNAKARIAGTDGDVSAAQLPANAKLREVTLHACGQNLQEWRDKFPNACFESWSGTVSNARIYPWQWFHTYSNPNRAATNDPLQECTFFPPNTDPYLELTYLYEYVPALGGFIASWDHLSNRWRLTENTRAAFGSSGAINFRGVKQAPAETTFFFAVAVVDGRLAIPDTLPAVTPDFEVFYTREGFVRTQESAAYYRIALGNGQLSLRVRRAGLAPEVAADVIGELVFGEHQGPIVPAAAPWGAGALTLLLAVAALRGMSWRLRGFATPAAGGSGSRSG